MERLFEDELTHIRSPIETLHSRPNYKDICYQKGGSVFFQDHTNFLWPGKVFERLDRIVGGKIENPALQLKYISIEVQFFSSM